MEFHQAYHRGISLWTRNCLLKSGFPSTGEMHCAVLTLWNDVSQCSFYMTGFLWSFVVWAVRGVAMGRQTDRQTKYLSEVLSRYLSIDKSGYEQPVPVYQAQEGSYFLLSSRAWTAFEGIYFVHLGLDLTLSRAVAQVFYHYFGTWPL